MVTLKDIATACGVSVSTVSKALNNSSELRKETIDLVSERARKLGYTPNSIARSLRTNHTKNIGVLFALSSTSGLKHEYFDSILDSIKTEAESRGYDLTFINSTDSRMTYLEKVRYRNFDGVIIASATDYNSAKLVDLLKSNIPCVLIDYKFRNCISIMSDNEDGAYSLAKYVFAKGHRRIAFITGEDTPVTEARLRGFTRACRERGVEPNPDHVRQSRFHDPDSSYEQTLALFAQDPDITCLFYPDDVSMIGGLRALGKLGRKVPQDVSAIGYDGIAISRIMRPVFTTYVQSSDAIGKLAAEKLIDQIEKPKAIKETLYVKGIIQEGDTLAEPIRK